MNTHSIFRNLNFEDVLVSRCVNWNPFVKCPCFLLEIFSVCLSAESCNFLGVSLTCSSPKVIEVFLKFLEKI